MWDLIASVPNDCLSFYFIFLLFVIYIYLALSSKYFLWALLANTIFNGLFCEGSFRPSLKHVRSCKFSIPKLELSSFTFSSSRFLFSSPLGVLCSTKLNNTKLFSRLFRSSSSLDLASTSLPIFSFKLSITSLFIFSILFFIIPSVFLSTLVILASRLSSFWPVFF